MGTDTNEAVPSKPSKSKPVDHNSQSKGAHDPEDRGAASQRASRDAGRGRQSPGRTGRSGSAPRRLHMPSSDEEEKTDPESPQAPPPPSRAGPSRSDEDDEQFDSARSASTTSTSARGTSPPVKSKSKPKSSKRNKTSKSQSPHDGGKPGVREPPAKSGEPKTGPPATRSKAAPKSEPVKNPSPKSVAVEVSSDSSADGQPRSPTFAEQIDEARKSGQSFSLGPGGTGARGSHPPAAQLVREALGTWVNTPASRVFPRASRSPRVAPELVAGRSAEVLDRFAHTSWMHFFEVVKKASPSEPRLEMFAIRLDHITALEKVAVLQTVLFQAGYSFLNLIPGIWSGDPRLQHVRHEELLNDVQEAMVFLALEVEEWVLHKYHQSQMRPADVSPFDVSAMRREMSELSSASSADGTDHSSDWYMASHSSRYGSSSLQSMATPPRPVAASPAPPVAPTRPAPEVPLSSAHMGLGAESRPTPIRMDTRAAPDAAGTGAMAVVYGGGAAGAPVVPRSVAAQSAQPAVVMTSVTNPPPSNQASPASQTAGSDPPLAFRPFIPTRMIDLFYGTEKFAERKAWSKEYRYVGQYWTDEEKCRNMKLFLRGPALAWYKQLLAAVRYSWPSLSVAFDTTFCTPPGSVLDQYYEMTQRKDETPLQHLWRLNAAAKEARVPLAAAKDVEEHINRFLRTLTSEELRSSLATHPFTSVGELQKVLEKLESLQSRRESSRSSSRDRERERERARERERSRERESRDWSVSRSASVYYTYDSERGSFEPVDNAARGVRFEDEEEMDSDISDGELVYQALGQGASKTGSGWRPNSQHPSRGFPPRPAFGANQQVTSGCYKCGQPGHYARECPSVDPMVSAPREPSKKPCLLCDVVHGPGECEVNNTLAEIKSWMKANAATAGAGSAPVNPQPPLN